MAVGMLPPPPNIVLISGSRGMLMLVKDEELKSPARLLNCSRLTFSYPLKKDLRLREVPKGEPAGRVMFTFSNEDMLNGKYDWASAKVIVGIGIIISERFNEFPIIDFKSIEIESLFNLSPYSF